MSELLDGGVGLVRQLENKTTSIPRTITRLQTEVVEAESTIAEADARLGQPFKHADELVRAYERSTIIASKMAEHLADKQQPNETVEVPAATSSRDAASPRPRTQRPDPAAPFRGPQGPAGTTRGMGG